MAIRIITDSTSDIPIEAQIKLGIDIVPLSVIFGDKKYTDGVDLKKETFYNMLSECKTLPSTSQVNPDGFLSLFQDYIDADDQVIGIFISSKLSGTYQSALIAKDMIGSDDIHIIDSKNTTFALAFLVFEAIRLRADGIVALNIAQTLTELREKARLFAVVDTLKYLKMGGRLSSSAAIIGGMMQIKPLITVENGKVESIGKARGQRAAFSSIVNLIKQNEMDTRYPIFFGHTNAPHMLDAFVNVVGKSFDITNREVFDIGCVVGTHTGPGCVGLCYVEK